MPAPPVCGPGTVGLTDDRWRTLTRPRSTALATIETANVEAIAVACSFLPQPVTRAEVAPLRRRFPGMHVSLSSEVLPEMLEFERTSTTVVNAYVAPLIKTYLNHLRAISRACQTCTAAGHAVEWWSDRANSAAERRLRSSNPGRRLGSWRRRGPPRKRLPRGHYAGHGRHHHEGLDHRTRDDLARQRERGGFAGFSEQPPGARQRLPAANSRH